MVCICLLWLIDNNQSKIPDHSASIHDYFIIFVMSKWKTSAFDALLKYKEDEVALLSSLQVLTTNLRPCFSLLSLNRTLKCRAKKIILVQCTLPFMNKKHLSPFSACKTSENSLLDGLLVSDTQRLRAMNKTNNFSLMKIPNRDSIPLPQTACWH